MNDLEQIKQELSADLLEEGSWGDLAKKAGTQMKNYAFHGSTNPATTLLKDKPAALADLAKILGVKASKMEDLLTSNKIDDATKQQIKTFFGDYDTINQLANDAKLFPQGGTPAAAGQSQLYPKIVAASKQFSTKFIADFKKIAATLNDANLTKYADKFSQVTLTEMMANPAAGSSSLPDAKHSAKAAAKKASATPTPPPAAKDAKKGGDKPEAPIEKPAPKQMPPEFIDLKKSVNDFIISLGTMSGINATTSKDALEGIIMSNLITVDEKKRLKVFVQKHLQVIKHLKSQLNKQAVSAAAPAPTPPAAPSATPSGSEK